MDWESGNNAICELAGLIRDRKANPYTGKLKVGVDLGTANIVIAVVDEKNRSIAGVMQGASVVRDGIVVDYFGASQIVKKLKRDVETILGTDLTKASVATAIPPGILTGNSKIMANVVDAAGFLVPKVVDEPTAAARVLGITNGAVVDVGGGTTGISIFKNGDVVFTADEATGGTHMTLVLAGFHQISLEEAEEYKKTASQKKVFPIIKPVVQKMAAIVNRFLIGYDVDTIYVVGGSSIFDEFEKTFEDETGIKTIKPVEPLLVTPLGIAFNASI